MGNGYLGSSNIQSSVAGREIIPASPSNWTGGYRVRKLSFDNEQNCTIILNGTTTIFLKAGLGFEMDYEDASITSFVIVESGINYTWIGAF